MALSHTEDVVSRTAEALKITPSVALGVHSHGLGACRVVTVNKGLLTRSLHRRSGVRGAVACKYMLGMAAVAAVPRMGRTCHGPPAAPVCFPGAAGAIQAA